MDQTAVKYCPKCEQDLPIYEFGKDRHTKSGLTSLCKPCRRRNYTDWANSNPDKRKARIEQDKRRMIEKYHQDPAGLSTYHSAHAKTRRIRGSASEYLCECGLQAEQWAYNHMDPDEISTTHGTSFSLNTDFYVAMCRKCHSIFDHNRDRK